MTCLPLPESKPKTFPYRSPALARTFADHLAAKGRSYKTSPEGTSPPLGAGRLHADLGADVVGRDPQVRKRSALSKLYR